MDHLDIAIEDGRWDAPGFAALTRRAVETTLEELGVDPEICEISILGCDDERIAALNTDFREKAQATNVLSWPAEERGATIPGTPPDLPKPCFDGMIELGDIAISYDTCTREAAEAGKPMADHVTHLIVHGTLHLFGYDHINDADAALMEAQEVKILGKMGLGDPYSDH
jgi:probable rRNA maturation factor